MKINEDQFTELVLNSDVPVLVYFYTDWCRYCKAMTKTIEEVISKEENKYKVYKVNTDECPNLTKIYKIAGLPTFKAYRDGQVSSTLSGVQSTSNLQDMVT